MSHSLCNRCEQYSGCLLNFDGKPCRTLRSVEPTNYDRLTEMSAEQLAAFHAAHPCPPEKNTGRRICLIGDISVDKCTACWLEYLNAETKESLA